jgi:hypothetical protein
VRANVWRRKTPWFAAAAVVSLIAGGAGFLRPVMDRQAVETAQASPEMNRVSAAQRLGRQQKEAWEQIAAATSIGYRAENVRRLLDRRDIHQRLLDDVRGILTSGGAAPTEEIAGSPDEWRGLSLYAMNTEYVTPSGDAAKAPRSAPAGQTAPAPASRTSGALASAGDSGRDSGRDARGGARGGQAPGAGTLRVQLQVDATNSGQLAFIDATVLEWLRENAEREGAPYTLTVPTVDDVLMETVQVGRLATAETPDAPTPAESGEGSTSSRQDDGRTRRGASRSTASRSGAAVGGERAVEDIAELSRIAPLPEIDGRFPPEATVYRYTITFDANLKGPEATRFAIDEEAPAEARAEAGQS